MEIIAQSQKNIAKIWGKQKAKKVKYRFLKYLIQVEYEKECYLHNVVTGELIKLNEKENKILKSLPCEYDEEISALIEHYFLVPEDFDEEKSINQILKIYRMVNKENYVNHFTILPTTYCNAHCFYCYESQYDHINMSEETVDILIDYMIKKSNNHPIHINWFGGEPLLRKDLISYVSKQLAIRNISFVAEMYSNGYLFSEELIHEAIQVWNLKKIQITIDGTEEVYNTTKAYMVTNDNPYFKVLNNIKLLLEKGVRVDIRLNLGMHNIEDIHNLVNELLERFGGYKNALIYVRCLFDDKGFVKVKHTDDELRVLYETQHKLTEKIRAKSRYVENMILPYIRTNNCMADNDKAEVVYPDGSLFKCEHIQKEDCIGNIKTAEKDEKKIEKWHETMVYSPCVDCCLRPKCRILKYCEGSVICFESDKERKISAYKDFIKLYLNRCQNKEDNRNG